MNKVFIQSPLLWNYGFIFIMEEKQSEMKWEMAIKIGLKRNLRKSSNLQSFRRMLWNEWYFGRNFFLYIFLGNYPESDIVFIYGGFDLPCPFCFFNDGFSLSFPNHFCFLSTFLRNTVTAPGDGKAILLTYCRVLIS